MIINNLVGVIIIRKLGTVYEMDICISFKNESNLFEYHQYFVFVQLEYVNCVDYILIFNI